MLNYLSSAVITAVRTMNTEALSALPGAPVVTETPRAAARPRTYRTRTALATRLASFADFVSPSNGVPSHQPASSR
jgi:hypothetical protein